MKRVEEELAHETVFLPVRFLDAGGNHVPASSEDLWRRAVDVVLLLEDGEEVVASLKLFDEGSSVTLALGPLVQ